jgi:RHS repeat-associated protein
MVVDVTTGQIVQQMAYDEFGNVTQDTNAGFQPFGYAGGLYDKDTGLVRFGARDYDPMTGKWTAKDPIRFKGGDTNLFNYVANNPVNFVDPMGTSTCTLGCDVVCEVACHPTVAAGCAAGCALLPPPGDAVSFMYCERFIGIPGCIGGCSKACDKICPNPPPPKNPPKTPPDNCGK